MRFLTVSAFFAGHGGGIEVVAGNLAQALADRGHDSHWAATDLDPAPAQRGVEAVPLRAFDPIERTLGLPMPLLLPAAMRDLDRQVRAADAVIIHDALYMPSILAAASARKHRKPWLLVQHVGTIPYSRAPLRLAMRAATAVVTRPTLRKAPQAVFISEAVRQEFADMRFRRAPQLLFNGVDSTLFRSAEKEERAALRAELAAGGYDEVLLFVGRFVEKKGLGVIEALARQRPKSLFVMAGSGPIAPQRWALANVRVLGKCTQSQLAELYRAADALLLPSVGEGYPLVIQEAMASGLPVFCGPDSAAADPNAGAHLIGVAVDHTDPEGTAARFAAALAKVPLSASAEAAAYARAAYSWPANAERVEALLRAQL